MFDAPLRQKPRAYFLLGQCVY